MFRIVTYHRKPPNPKKASWKRMASNIQDFWLKVLATENFKKWSAFVLGILVKNRHFHFHKRFREFITFT